MRQSTYDRFLMNLEQQIKKEKFLKDLNNFQEIDANHYNKMIKIETMIEIIEEYKTRQVNEQQEIQSVKILTIGNPELIFRLGIEAVLNNFKKVIISINDFCLAQDEFIISFFKRVYRQIRYSIDMELINLENEVKLISDGKKFDRIISISDSYRYYLLKDKLKNVTFYPYNLFELYADSDEFDDLKKKVFDYASFNGYEIGIYDEEMTLEDAINLMNVDGYGFGCILLSKDKEAGKKFKKEVKSKYVIVNQNPFSKTKFVLEI